MGERKTVSLKEWKKRMAQCQISTQDLNRLVMNYFVTEGYKEAAESFKEESGTEGDTDDETLAIRTEIRDFIQKGNLSKAVNMINDLDPNILDTNPDLLFRVQQQQVIELIREGKNNEAIEYARSEMSSLAEENPHLLADLERTLSLLAYNGAEGSPVGDLLDMAQRAATAGAVNAAILSARGQDSVARLPFLLKMLQWAQSRLDEKMRYPRINDFSTGELQAPDD